MRTSGQNLLLCLQPPAHQGDVGRAPLPGSLPALPHHRWSCRRMPLPLPPFLPLSQLECAQHRPAVSPGLVLLVRGGQGKHHSWKSDLYLKNKKSIKPQLFCNKPLVLTCPNACAVSLLASVGGCGRGDTGQPLRAGSHLPCSCPGRASASRPGMSHRSGTIAHSGHSSGSVCSSPLCLLLRPLETPGDAIPRMGLARSAPRRERLGCGRGARSCQGGVAPVGG